ncbi:hypothetical protein EMCRGX_G031163 [Ephydatia muelleri]
MTQEMDTEHQSPYSLMNNAESEPKSNGIGTNLPKQSNRAARPLRSLKSNVDFTVLGRSELELKANLYYHIIRDANSKFIFRYDNHISTVLKKPIGQIPLRRRR